MYLNFYGLSEKPFNITPNPRFVFLSKHHREVFAHLLFGIRRHAGFIEVTGEVGTGKTTVLRTLFAELEKSETRIAYIFNPCLSAPDLLRAVNREFGLPTRESAADLHADLNSFLLQEHAAGRTVVLVIDEAQNLEASVLEQVRLLSNLETETDKLIQIVLVGQPELGQLLDRPELRQLSQRITVHYHLQAMDQDDTAAYIEHRLSVAGWTRGHLFNSDALRVIYRQTRGNPRLINILCDRALLVGYAEGNERIGPTEIRKAGRELRRKQTLFPLPVPALWLLLLIPLVASGFWFATRTSLPSPPSPLVAAAPPAVDLLVTEILPALRSAPPAEGRREASNVLLALWGGQPLVGSADTIEEQLNLSREQRFEVARLSGDLGELLRLGLPLLLELEIDGQRRYLPLRGARSDRLQVMVNGQVREIADQALTPYWHGRAYLLWRNPLNLPIVKGPLREANQIVALQTLLAQAGVVVERSGRYDAATSTAVRTFQATHGLPADGIAGLQTLIALYRQSGRYGYPQFSSKEVGR